MIRASFSFWTSFIRFPFSFIRTLQRYRFFFFLFILRFLIWFSIFSWSWTTHYVSFLNCINVNSRFSLSFAWFIFVFKNNLLYFLWNQKFLLILNRAITLFDFLLLRLQQILFFTCILKFFSLDDRWFSQFFNRTWNNRTCQLWTKLLELCIFSFSYLNSWLLLLSLLLLILFLFLLFLRYILFCIVLCFLNFFFLFHLLIITGRINQIWILILWMHQERSLLICLIKILSIFQIMKFTLFPIWIFNKFFHKITSSMVKVYLCLTGNLESCKTKEISYRFRNPNCYCVRFYLTNLLFEFSAFFFAIFCYSSF